MFKCPKNLILYGPPGTGKTYNTVNYAVAIIEGKEIEEVSKEDRAFVLERYNNYKAECLIEFCTFHQSYGYEEFIEGIKPDLEVDTVKYKLENGVFKAFCEKEDTIQPRNRVFIIDEINRGNISKIFGELITLLEDSKRIGEQEAMRIRLPYSGKKFGVPNNVYVIGTMNTADRSIALIDTALRRRFKFVEMQPDTDLLKDVVVEGIEIQKVLCAINERIEALYDREHTIGHSFFMELKDNPKMEMLTEIFANSVLPLLKEYFYDDFEKIAIVLNDDLHQEIETNFVSKKNINIPAYNEVMTTYKFNQEALRNSEAYKKIYLSN